MFLLLLLCCSWLFLPVKSVTPAPVKMVLTSANMSHSLQWHRDSGTPADVTYSVSFHTDRFTCCRVVPGCEHVVEPLLCDLTKTFYDPEETYHVRITAYHRSELFSTPWLTLLPIKDTELQLPVLRLEHCEPSLCVDLDAPLPSLSSLYNSFWYELKVQVDSQEPKLESFRSLERQVEPRVKAGSRYCVSIRFSDPVVPRVSNFSPPQCVSIPSPLHAERLLAGFSAVLVLLVLIVLAFKHSGFICLRQQALPSALTSVHHVDKKLVLLRSSVSSLSVIKPAAPLCGQTQHCSSESDDSDEESSTADTRADACVAPYTSKGSLCSKLSTSSSAPPSKEEEEQVKTEEDRAHRAEEEVRPEEEDRAERAEEVNLLTLTISRNLHWELGSAALSEVDLSGWNVAEEQPETEDMLAEECVGSGYMSRPTISGS